MQPRHDCVRCHRIRTEQWLRFVGCTCQLCDDNGHWVCKSRKSCDQHRRRFLKDSVERYWKNRKKAGG